METTRRRKRKEEVAPQWLADLLKDCGSTELLVEHLRGALEKHQLTVGTRLPSIRQFQQLTGLRHHEVCQALDTLAAEARIEQRRGSGTYVTNGVSARLLSERATFRIGIVPPSFDPILSHPGAAFCQAGIAMAADVNFRVQIVPPRIADEMPMEFVEHVRSMRLDGLIWIQPPVSPPPALVRLIDAKVPVVLTGRSYPYLPVKSVTWDHKALAQAVVDFMLLKKRKRLVCMVGIKGDPYSDGPVDALRTALEEHRLVLAENQIVTNRTGSASRFHSITLRESVQQFFVDNPRFDTIFSLYPDHLDVLDQMHLSGQWRCPDNFIHLHFSSTNKWTGQRWPSFPTAYLEAPPETVGRQAVRELERLLGVASDHGDEVLSPTIVHDPYTTPGR